jgi:hypothetical protein
MGMLERMREPNAPLGVAPPGAASRADGEDAFFDVEEADLSASSRRNWSLFMAACSFKN